MNLNSIIRISWNIIVMSSLCLSGEQYDFKHPKITEIKQICARVNYDAIKRDLVFLEKTKRDTGELAKKIELNFRENENQYSDNEIFVYNEIMVYFGHFNEDLRVLLEHSRSINKAKIKPEKIPLSYSGEVLALYGTTGGFLRMNKLYRRIIISGDLMSSSDCLEDALVNLLQYFEEHYK